MVKTRCSNEVPSPEWVSPCKDEPKNCTRNIFFVGISRMLRWSEKVYRIGNPVGVCWVLTEQFRILDIETPYINGSNYIVLTVRAAAFGLVCTAPQSEAHWTVSNGISWRMLPGTYRVFQLRVHLTQRWRCHLPLLHKQPNAYIHLYCRLYTFGVIGRISFNQAESMPIQTLLQPPRIRPFLAFKRPNLDINAIQFRSQCFSSHRCATYSSHSNLKAIKHSALGTSWPTMLTMLGENGEHEVAEQKLSNNHHSSVSLITHQSSLISLQIPISRTFNYL